MLTRIRNAARVGKPQVNINASKICEGIAKVLKEEGYIEGYERIEAKPQDILRVALKYDEDGRSVISDIQRTSKPGCRVYRGFDDLPDVLGGMGVVVVSTSQGVLSDRNCRQNKIGGEILCTVS